MTPFERRLKALEARRAPSGGIDVRFWKSPEGMTDLSEQQRWFEKEVAAAPVSEGCKMIEVHFVNPPAYVG